MSPAITNAEIFVDNFAGGGGASTGIEIAIGRNVDIAINHDPEAIRMHRANHPDTKHYTEDVFAVDPREACAGRPVALAWFSPDCTHFSRAKGGKPVEKKIRGLAWVTLRWAYYVRPRVIMLENVPEIQTWGPLGEDGKPIKSRAGETFDGFIKALSTGIPRNHPAFAEMCETLSISPDSEMARALSRGMGYVIEHRCLRSCDYGAPTTRTRFYMIARSDGKPIVWPKPTHAPKNSEAAKRGELLPYRTAAECIDWTNLGESIFERKKPFAENTLRRIARGIQKFIINNPEPFIVTVNHSGEGFRGQSIDEPLCTVTAKNGYGVVAPTLIQYHDEQGKNEARGQKLDEPIKTLDTSNRYALSVASLIKHYGGGYAGHGNDVREPLSTITAKDHNALVAAHIVTLRNHMDGQRADEPLSTISCSGAHHAEVAAFLIKYYSGGVPKPVDMPIDTVTTLERFALITVDGVDYIITDIKMRMLEPRELYDCQGFPHDYIIDMIREDGKPYQRAEKVAKAGNAVTPPVAAALVRANLPEYCGAGK